MIKSLIPLACLSLAAVPVAVLAGDTHGAMNPETIKWAPAEGPPKGAQMAVLQGDPSKAGIFTIRLKAPANYKVPAHWHSTEESVTVISGTLYMGDGDKIDTAKAKAVKAGGFMQVRRRRTTTRSPRCRPSSRSPQKGRSTSTGSTPRTIPPSRSEWSVAPALRKRQSHRLQRRRRGTVLHPGDDVELRRGNAGRQRETRARARTRRRLPCARDVIVG